MWFFCICQAYEFLQAEGRHFQSKDMPLLNDLLQVFAILT